MDYEAIQRDVLVAYGREIVSPNGNSKKLIYERIKAKSRYEKYKRLGHIHGMKKWKKIWNYLEKRKIY